MNFSRIPPPLGILFEYPVDTIHFSEYLIKAPSGRSGSDRRVAQRDPESLSLLSCFLPLSTRRCTHLSPLRSRSA